METLNLIGVLWAGFLEPAQVLAALPFSPFKLILLILWVYSCLYFVQVIQFSALVPKSYKSIAVLATFTTGPMLWLTLFTIAIVRKSFASSDSIFEIIRQHIVDAIDRLRFGGDSEDEDDSSIRLLDSSGRDINQIYGHGAGKKQTSKVLSLTEDLIADALDRRASDILIDPKDEKTYAIRLRIDGLLRVVEEFDTDTCKAVVNSIKAVASMDIAEKRRPQDGAFIARRGGTTASFRVASAGVLNGEKLSIRVLNQSAGTFNLADVGLSKKQAAIIQGQISKPSGMVLMCGPTGSGKTTTMYAMLNEIDRFTRNVITVEDPIEAVLPEASQIEINPKADITFAKALRNILRQDPDVICVGEIRDEETAEIALRAAQTGHLVMATVHCDSNATALIRLLDLGVSPLLLSSGLNLLVSQRLMRKLCEDCKRPAKLNKALAAEFTKKKIDYRRMCEPVGCDECEGTGYYGRLAICDTLVISNELRAAIAENMSLITDLRTKGKRRDNLILRQEALRRVMLGLTSLSELKRVVG